MMRFTKHTIELLQKLKQEGGEEQSPEPVSDRNLAPTAWLRIEATPTISVPTGYDAGTIVRWNEHVGNWDEFEEVLIKPANTDALKAGGIYLGQRAGKHTGGHSVYVIEGCGCNQEVDCSVINDWCWNVNNAYCANEFCQVQQTTPLKQVIFFVDIGFEPCYATGNPVVVCGDDPDVTYGYSELYYDDAIKKFIFRITDFELMTAVYYNVNPWIVGPNVMVRQDSLSHPNFIGGGYNPCWDKFITVSPVMCPVGDFGPVWSNPTNQPPPMDFGHDWSDDINLDLGAF